MFLLRLFFFQFGLFKNRLNLLPFLLCKRRPLFLSSALLQTSNGLFDLFFLQLKLRYLLESFILIELDFVNKFLAMVF